MDGTKRVTGGKGGVRIGRRHFLAGAGASGLAAAGVVFGFAKPALALVNAGCCTLYCNPSHNLSQCETGTYYVWECTESSGYLYCNCCEHGNPGYRCSKTPCQNCNSSNYSSYSCQYP